MNKDLEDQEVLKTKVNNIIKELQENDQKALNTVDPECGRMNSVQGSHAGYNAQAVVDEKHGLIVNTDVVSKNNDVNQFANQINQANETTGKKCKTACADSGYANTDELKKIDEQEIKVIVPTQKKASKKEPKEFDKEHFKYDTENDSYICPEGHRLKLKEVKNKKGAKKYKIKRGSTCRHCDHFRKCTTAKNGRTILRLNNEEVKKKLEKEYADPESQKIYKLRQQKSELPFGHIKRNLGVSSFLLRGRKGTNAEMAIMAICFNLVRMTNIMGIPEFIEQIKA